MCGRWRSNATCAVVESVAAAVAAVVQEFGRLDILVNNAGTFETAVLQSITLAQWDKMFETNTRGPFLMAQAAYPHLYKPGDASSISAHWEAFIPGQPTDITAPRKPRSTCLTQTMAKAFAPQISVNCVAPGMIVNGEVDPAYEHFANKTPMQRNGTTNDVAEAVLFFARGPHFITGQILGVDGGLGL